MQAELDHLTQPRRGKRAKQLLATFLIVSDKTAEREALARILETQYAVEQAVDGQEALAHLHRNAGTFTGVIVDALLPDMECADFLRALREETALAALAIVVTSDDNAETDLAKAFSLGACENLLRPYDPDIVCRRIARVVWGGPLSPAVLSSEVENAVMDHACDLYGVICLRDGTFRYDRLNGGAGGEPVGRVCFYEKDIVTYIEEHASFGNVVL